MENSFESNKYFLPLQKRKRKEKEDDTVSLSSFDLKVYVGFLWVRL